MKFGELKTVAEYISSQTRWMFLQLMKVTRVFRVSLSKMVPSGLDGFAKIKPFTLMFDFVAFSYASSSASFVI